MNYSRSVFEFDNYRHFLREVYNESKAQNEKYSFRYFSRLFGFASPNFFKLIIEGQRNLALPGAEKIAKGLKLNKEEEVFFKNLVLMNQATTLDEKQEYAQELMKCKTYRKLHPLRDSEMRYLSVWYYVPIREMVNLKGFKEEPEWIAAHVYPAISPEQAKSAVDELLKLGLLERDKKGRLIQRHAHLSTADEVVSAVAAQYHRNMIDMGKESIDRFTREKREIAAVAFGVNADKIQLVKEMLQKFRKDLLKVVAQEQGSNRIYQLNLQFFPLAGSPEEEEVV